MKPKNCFIALIVTLSFTVKAKELSVEEFKSLLGTKNIKNCVIKPLDSNKNVKIEVRFTENGVVKNATIHTTVEQLDKLPMEKVEQVEVWSFPNSPIMAIFFKSLPIVFLLLLVFWIVMLVNCLCGKWEESKNKLIWVIILVTTNFLGAILYFFIGRKQKA